MLEIIIQFERPAFGLTIDADKSDIPRWRGTTQCLNSFLGFNATALFNILQVEVNANATFIGHRKGY
jgi:hypothetical protein